MTQCPICDSAELAQTTEKHSLRATLERWESVLHSPFPVSVWNDLVAEGKEEVSLSVCPNCAFGCFFPIVAGSAEFYRAISATDYYNTEKWEFACALSDLKALGAKRVLDVGCGSGYFLNILAKGLAGAELCGYEFNATLLEGIQKRGIGTLSGSLAEVAAMSAQVEPFDAICIIQVLEHVTDPVAFLKTFISLLRPGGSLIITTPDFAGPIANFQDALTEIPPHHLTRWSESTFLACLPRLGMKVEQVMKEPLPDYLWDSYLPVVWDGSWPAALYDSIGRCRGLEEKNQRVGFAAEQMKAAGIRWLHGIPGHTIYVCARKHN